jgi:hypothetical protein
MKRARIFILFLFWNMSMQAQLSSSFKNLQLVQINLHSIQGNVLEIGYVNLKNRYLNFQIKASYRNYRDPISNRPIIFHSNLSYIKPGLILIKKQSLAHTFFVSLNPILGYSKDYITFEIMDPILGKSKLDYSEKNFHFAFEFETNFIADLSKRVAVSLGWFAGFRIYDPKPFSTKFKGSFIGHDFIGPGTGYNSFIAGINLGLVIRINTKKNKL